MKVASFRDLMAGRLKAEIRCATRNITVRRLSVAGAYVTIEPLQGPSIVVPLATPIEHYPVCFDRGDMLFMVQDESGPPVLKICTELDIVAFPDGSEDRVEPANPR